MNEDSLIFASKGFSEPPRARARFLAQAIQLEEHPPSAVIRSAIYFSVVMLVAGVVWAWATHVNEVTVAVGEVVPAGLIHDVQHLEGGIVSEIEVRDGDRVKKGDLLLRFAPSAIESELEQTRIRRATLEMETERLQAIIDGREPDFGETGEHYPTLAAKQRTIYRAQIASHESERSVIDAQIRQRQTELTRQQHQAGSIRKEIDLLQQQVQMRSQLNQKKIIARTELLATQTRLAEAESEQRKLTDGVIVAQSALDEAKERRLETDARFAKETELQAGEAAAKLADVVQAQVRLQDRETRLSVHAPVNGIVQGLSITRINAVVEPGQVIMQIVPVEDEPIVEARISPNDIGHIHPGQVADVKVDSYDSARFGSLKGEILRISPSTYLDERRQPYYRAEIGLDKSWLGDPTEQLRIIPGMTVKADIKTGSKSILDYLLKPVSRGFDSAFRER